MIEIFLTNPLKCFTLQNFVKYKVFVLHEQGVIIGWLVDWGLTSHQHDQQPKDVIIIDFTPIRLYNLYIDTFLRDSDQHTNNRKRGV